MFCLNRIIFHYENVVEIIRQPDMPGRCLGWIQLKHTFVAFSLKSMPDFVLVGILLRHFLSVVCPDM